MPPLLPMRHKPVPAAMLLAIPLLSVSAQAQEVVLDASPLSACLAPELGVREVRDGQLLQHWSLPRGQAVGACGCHSALIRYRARAVGEEGDDVILQQGLINTLDTRTTAITLASDARLAKRLATKGLLIALSCAPSR